MKCGSTWAISCPRRGADGAGGLRGHGAAAQGPARVHGGGAGADGVPVFTGQFHQPRLRRAGRPRGGMGQIHGIRRAEHAVLGRRAGRAGGVRAEKGQAVPRRRARRGRRAADRAGGHAGDGAADAPHREHARGLDRIRQGAVHAGTGREHRCVRGGRLRRDLYPAHTKRGPRRAGRAGRLHLVQRLQRLLQQNQSGPALRADAGVVRERRDHRGLYRPLLRGRAAVRCSPK